MSSLASFELAIPTILANEGGYVNDPADPGGETNFGISKRSYPDVDIKGLTPEAASAIYKRDWWDKFGYSNFHAQTVATKVFDMAVNLGPPHAHRMVQFAAGVDPVDGVLGPKSYDTINACDPDVLITKLRTALSVYYTNLASRHPLLQKFLKGWLRRAQS